ncbi:MAG: hypothetical protein V3T86_12275 [Planctomycetota bacterium]
MKIRLTLMAFAASMIVACAGKKLDSGADNLAADARAVLVVSSEDGRYVDGGTAGARQIHYYSAQDNRTWIVDGESDKTLRTYAGKDVPEVTIIENACAGCGSGADDACGGGCGSACAACGCGSACAACGCGACSGNAEACACGAACGGGEESACGAGCSCGCATPGN